MAIDVVKEVAKGQILCKIQRPVFASNGDYGKLFIYDVERVIETEVVMEQEVLKELFPEGNYKGFAVCTLVEDEQILGALRVKIEALLDPSCWPEW